MKNELQLDIAKCVATLYQNDEEVTITNSVHLSHVHISIYSKRNHRIEYEDTIEYTLDDAAKKFSPIVYWLVKGLHGIPLEYRNV